MRRALPVIFALAFTACAHLGVRDDSNQGLMEAPAHMGFPKLADMVFKPVQGPDLAGDGRPNDFHWPSTRLPIPVCPMLGLAIGYPGLLHEVVSEINDLAHNQVLAVSPAACDTLNPRDLVKAEVGGSKAPKGFIVVFGDRGVEPKKGLTYQYWLPNGYMYSATIQLPDAVVNKSNAHNMVMHELLHGLGFGHSHDVNSVMYPICYTAAELTKQDAALLRHVYGPPQQETP